MARRPAKPSEVTRPAATSAPIAVVNRSSSRVQALNNEFVTTILNSETTFDAVRGELYCLPMPETRIRVIQRPHKFYEVTASRDAAALQSA